MVVNFNSGMGVNNIYSAKKAQAASIKGNVSNIHFKSNLDKDSAEFNHAVNKKPLTLDDKKEIKHQARNNATGWAIFGGAISTLYYGLRSDKTIAKKYNLDVEKDKDFIKEIRKDQVKWTIPSILPGYSGNPLGVVAWIYSKCQDANDMTIKSEKA